MTLTRSPTTSLAKVRPSPGPWRVLYGMLTDLRARVSALERAGATGCSATAAASLWDRSEAGPPRPTARAVGAHVVASKALVVRMSDGSEICIGPVRDPHGFLAELPAKLFDADLAALDDLAEAARRRR